MMKSAKVDLSKALGRGVDEPIFKYMVKKSYVKEYEDDFMSLSKLVAEYRKLEELSQGKGQKRPGNRNVTRRQPPDRRNEVLSQILAEEVNTSLDVTEFRKEFLEGKLIKEKDVWNWLDSRMTEQGTLKGTPVNDLGVMWHDILILVKRGTALHQLKQLVDYLVDEFPVWEERSVIDLVLAGTVPPVFPVKVTTSVGRPLPFDRFIMDIDPRISPRDVMNIYSFARREYWGDELKRDRPMSEKHLTLAGFARNKYRQNLSWETLRRSWNKNYPEWAYTGASAITTFPRDAKSAWERVLGIKWNDQPFIESLILESQKKKRVYMWEHLDLTQVQEMGEDKEIEEQYRLFGDLMATFIAIWKSTGDVDSEMREMWEHMVSTYQSAVSWYRSYMTEATKKPAAKKAKSKAAKKPAGKKVARGGKNDR